MRVNDSVRLHGNLITKISKTNFVPKKPKGFDKRYKDTLQKIIDTGIKNLIEVNPLAISLTEIEKIPGNMEINNFERAARFRSTIAKQVDVHKAVLEKHKQLLKQLGLHDADINYLLKL